jgi:hypothetical protein
MALPDGMLSTFASTFKEWHYLVGGACAGFVLGWVLHAAFAVAAMDVQDDGEPED